MPRIIS